MGSHRHFAASSLKPISAYSCPSHSSAKETRALLLRICFAMKLYTRRIGRHCERETTSEALIVSLLHTNIITQSLAQTFVRLQLGGLARQGDTDCEKLCQIFLLSVSLTFRHTHALTHTCLVMKLYTQSMDQNDCEKQCMKSLLFLSFSFAFRHRHTRLAMIGTFKAGGDAESGGLHRNLSYVPPHKHRVELTNFFLYLGDVCMSNKQSYDLSCHLTIDHVRLDD